MAEATPYVYRPLDETKEEIRLLLILSLLPASSSDYAIHITIEHVPCERTASRPQSSDRGADKTDIDYLHKWPQFSALSYQWGEPCVDGPRVLLKNHPHPVTPNVYYALRRLQQLQRHHCDWPCKFWIDALCINQADVAERNNQVSRMKDIYSSASTVLCYLTPTLAEDVYEPSFYGPWDRQSQRLGGTIEHRSWYSITTSVDLLLQQRSDLEVDHWLNIYALFASPYWSRLWVVQETALASDNARIVTLKGILTWEQLRAAANVIWNQQFQDFDKLRMVLGSEEALLLCARANHILNILWAGHAIRHDPETFFCDTTWSVDVARDTDSSDPRDKVYELLSLLDPALVSKIQPDYDRPVATIVTEFSGLGAEMSQSLAALPQCADAIALLRPGEDLPSWAPDLTRTDDVSYFRSDSCTSYTLQGTISFDGFRKQLRVTGVVLDTIGMRSAAYGVHYDKSCSNLHHDYTVCRQEVEPDAQNQSVLLDVLLSGQHAEDLHSRHLPSVDLLRLRSDVSESSRTVLRFFDKLRKFSYQESDLQQIWQSTNFGAEHAPEDEIKATEAIDSVLGSRRLTRTTEGRLGIVPADALSGDVLCAMYGLDDIAVLGKLPESWTWIGTAYVSGLMQGQGLLERNIEESVSA